MKRLLPILLLTSCSFHLPSPYLDLRESIEGPQGRLHVDEGGRGPGVPVVFVHGNGANLTQWRAQLDHERKSRFALAFDLRGMGRSDPPRNGDYSVAAMADDLDAVVTEIGLRRFVLVGHSYGGAVVADYAARYPGRVAGVVYADAGGDLTVDDAAAAKFLSALRSDKETVAQQWFAPMLKPSSEAVQKTVYDSVRNTQAEVLASALSDLRTFRMVKAVRAYPGPKLAIAAADIENPASLHVQIKDLPVKKISGTGHWLMLDKPDDFNAALDEFLNSVDAVGK